MGFLYELKIRARHVIWPAVSVCGLGYMTYHIVQGDRGLLAWKVLREQIAIAQLSLAESETERRMHEERVRLLHPEGLDRDMLDEWARRRLNFGTREEIVIFTEPTGPRETSARSGADAGTARR